LSTNDTNQSIEKFIESNKIKYSVQKGTQAANEYIAIITPFVNSIISLEKQIKELTNKLPKKQRMKIIKGKK